MFRPGDCAGRDGFAILTSKCVATSGGVYPRRLDRRGKPGGSSFLIPGDCTVNLKIFDLSGKVALVTGGSKGLGKSMARVLAQAGADIVISSRTEADLKAALPQILEGTGRKGKYVVADMAKRADV